MARKNKPGAGRPTDFNPEAATKIIERFKAGDTDVQAAEIIGKHFNTIRNWRKKYQEFLFATNEAKAEANALIESSTFINGMGYDYTEQVVTKDGLVEVRKHARGDQRAREYWLNNRDPKRWKNRVEIQSDIKDILNVVAGGNKIPIKR